MHEIVNRIAKNVKSSMDMITKLSSEVSRLRLEAYEKDAEILQLKSSNRNLVGACDKAKKYIKEIFDEVVTGYDSGTIEEDKNVIIEVIKTLKVIT